MRFDDLFKKKKIDINILYRELERENHSSQFKNLLECDQMEMDFAFVRVCCVHRQYGVFFFQESQRHHTGTRKINDEQVALYIYIIILFVGSKLIFMKTVVSFSQHVKLNSPFLELTVSSAVFSLLFMGSNI